MRQGGTTAVQEIAFTHSNAQAYIDQAVGRGHLTCQISH